MSVRFHTDMVYKDRKSKAQYVWRKYGEILKGRVLDIGADECHLKAYLPAESSYTGMDLCDRPGVIRLDLEKEPIPAANGAYDVVLCLDVMEHTENIGAVFGELCRVTSQWLIVSLPNPWSALMKTLISGKHRHAGSLQHYGLPVKPPPHRHKWFYAGSEAEVFVAAMAGKNGMEIVESDVEDPYVSHCRVPRSLEDLARIKTVLLQKMLFGRHTYLPDLHHGTRWWVLRKTGAAGKET